MRQLHGCKRDRSYKKTRCSLLLIVRRRATRGLERQLVVQDSIQFSFRGKLRGKYTQDMTLRGGQRVVHPHQIFSSKVTCSAWVGLNSIAAHDKCPHRITQPLLTIVHIKFSTSYPHLPRAGLEKKTQNKTQTQHARYHIRSNCSLFKTFGITKLNFFTGSSECKNVCALLAWLTHRQEY